jgi:phosphatidylinositol-3-phosphatase
VLAVVLASCSAAPAARTGPGSTGATSPSTPVPPTVPTTPSTTVATQPPRGRAGVPRFSHLFVVLMENLGYAGATGTPGFAALARRFATATSWYSIAHPSLPNYLAITSGGTWGVTSDCVECFVDVPDVGQQLSEAGVSWGAYMEGIPGPCFLADYGGNDYAAKHDPFRYYVAVRDSAALCAHIRPLSDLAPLLAGSASSLPSFVWVTPDLCHDGHDCSPGAAASWLTGFVAELTASAGWRHGGALVVTWDEGDDDSMLTQSGTVAPCCGGGHVLTIVAAPEVPAGEQIAVPYDHYSLLATIEDAFDVPLLGAARRATPLSAFFRG